MNWTRVVDATRSKVAVWIRRSPLGAALLDDRPLAVCTAVLAALTLVPLVLTPLLPYVDHPVNVGMAGLLWRAAIHKGVVGYHYAVNFAPIPYWTSYLLTAVFQALVGALGAAKLMSAVCSIALPLGMMRLLIALGRSPRLGLWAFAFSYDLNLHWGWVSYLIGMSIALVAVARVIEAKTFRDALRIVPLAALVSLSHVHAVGLFGLLASLLVLTKERPWRALGVHATAMAGMAVVIVPWLWKGVGSTNGASKFSAVFPPLPEKLSNLYALTLDTTALPSGANLTWCAFVLFVAGLFALAAVPTQSCSGRDRVRGVLIFVATLILYFALPFQVNAPFYHTFTYSRLASFVLLTALLVPCPDFSRWRSLALIPGIVAALLIQAATALEFSDFAPRARSYLAIMNHMEPNKRFFPLDLEYKDPAVRLDIYHMIHGYAAAEKQSYDPHLFNHPQNPLLYRHERMPPVINWFRPRTFDTDKHGIYYDYIIVKGLRRDPVRVGPSPKGPSVESIYENGDWRLYKVNNPLPPP